MPSLISEENTKPGSRDWQLTRMRLDKSGGFELGTGPSLVVLDSGFGKNFSSTTLQKGIYAFIFDQKGLMGGVGIQGTKITKINPT